MSPVFDEPARATPLAPEEQRDLIPSWISSRSELDEVERDNILRGQDWALSRRRPKRFRQKHRDNYRF